MKELEGESGAVLLVTGEKFELWRATSGMLVLTTDGNYYHTYVKEADAKLLREALLDREHEWKEQGDEATRVPFGKLCRKCVIFVPRGCDTAEPCVRRIKPLSDFQVAEGFAPVATYVTEALDGVLTRRVSDRSLVDDLCEIGDGLTDWEMSFTDSVAKQVDEGRVLSAKQRETIEKILERLG